MACSSSCSRRRSELVPLDFPSRNPRSVVAPALIACQISLNSSMLTSTATKPEATPSSSLRHIQTADKTIFTQIDHMEEDGKEWAVK